MPLIRDGHEVINDWAFIADGAELPVCDRLSVSLRRFLALAAGEERGALTRGVRLGPDDEPAGLLPYLSQLDLIEIEFPRYTDGRGYSLAQLIRRRYGFTGELRAVGHVLRDQIFYMHRSGFDAFETRRAGLDEVLEALGEVSVVYQPAADPSVPAFRRRSI